MVDLYVSSRQAYGTSQHYCRRVFTPISSTAFPPVRHDYVNEDLDRTVLCDEDSCLTLPIPRPRQRLISNTFFMRRRANFVTR